MSLCPNTSTATQACSKDNRTDQGFILTIFRFHTESNPLISTGLQTSPFTDCRVAVSQSISQIELSLPNLSIHMAGKAMYAEPVSTGALQCTADSRLKIFLTETCAMIRPMFISKSKLKDGVYPNTGNGGWSLSLIPSYHRVKILKIDGRLSRDQRWLLCG